MQKVLHCLSSTRMGFLVVVVVLLPLIQVEGDCHFHLKPIATTNTEVLPKLERVTKGISTGEISMRKEELCLLRRDAESKNSYFRYCIELKLEPNTCGGGPFDHFAKDFNWLKLDVVNSVIPGDSVGPSGIQLTFGVSSKYVARGGEYETVEEQLANTDVVMMLLKEIFGSFEVDCDNNNKSTLSPRKFRTLMLDTVLASPRRNGALLQLLSRPLFDRFMGSAIWAQLGNLVGFWHEQLIFNGLEESQFCKYSHLASSYAEDTNHLCDRTYVLPLMLSKMSHHWRQHSATQWLTKQFSLLLNHKEKEGLFISYCEIGSPKSHSENAYMPESGKCNSPSEIPEDCDINAHAELEMIVLQRRLNGKGAHRHLSSFMRFRYHGNRSSEVCQDFCEIVMMERIQPGIFVDPFELQHLVHRGVLKAAYVYGDANLELPSQHSHLSIVEVHAAVNIDSCILSGNDIELEVKVDLPLHARYPPLSTESYSVVNISIPHILLHCTYESQILNLNSSTSTQTQENNKLSWVSWSAGVSHTSEVLNWKIPAGNQLHAKFVLIFTTFSTLVSVVAIILASLYSLQYSEI